MTREETITNLEMIRVSFVEPVTEEQRKLIDDTFDIAIKVLEHPEQNVISVVPCGDTISRQAVLGLAYDMSEIDGEHFTEPYMVVDVEDIQKLPSVTPKQRWIPVSERLPEENKTVMASTEYGVFPEAKYTKEYGWEWAYEAGADYWKELEDVTAWMPLPKPYKVDPQESEG